MFVIRSYLFAFLLFIVSCIFDANTLAFNNNNIGSGSVCIVQNANSVVSNQVLSCQACRNRNFLQLYNCIPSAAATSGLIGYCSSNTTNSTIPTGSCTFCTREQVISCNVAEGIINNGDFVSDAIFGCFIRTCSGSPDIRYTGTVPVNKVGKVFVGLNNAQSQSANSILGRKKRNDGTSNNKDDELSRVFKDVYFTKKEDSYEFVGELKIDPKETFPTREVQIVAY